MDSTLYIKMPENLWVDLSPGFGATPLHFAIESNTAAERMGLK